MTAIVTLDLEGFRPDVTPEQQALAVHAIEDGGVLVLPRATFVLAEDEKKP